MASQFNLGTGLGNYFRARAAAPQIEAQAQAEAERQQMQAALLRGKVGDQQAADAAYQAMPNDLEQIGVPTGQGQAYTDVARATGSKSNELGQFFKTMTQMAYVKGAKDALARGDTQGSNFDLAAGGAHPIDYTKVEGGVGYNPNVAPLGQHFKPVPGQGVKRSVIPLSDVNAKVFMQPVPQYDVFGKPIIGPDGKPVTKPAFSPQAYTKFNQWAMDNGFSDMNQALPHYLKVQQAVQTQTAGEAAARHTVSTALQDAPMDPTARKLGAVYKTPKGPMKWVGNGWLPQQ